MRSFVLLTSMAIAIGLAGCGGDDGDTGPPPDTRCFDYGSFNGSSPEVSLRIEVMPILQTNCTFGQSCHGPGLTLAGKVYLGPVMGVQASDAEIQRMLDENVNADPSFDAGMKLITPGDASKSFLMHKTDNSLECPTLACAPDDCGDPMPFNRPAIDAGDRNTIRRWIMQGAQLN